MSSASEERLDEWLDRMGKGVSSDVRALLPTGGVYEGRRLPAALDAREGLRECGRDEGPASAGRPVEKDGSSGWASSSSRAMLILLEEGSEPELVAVIGGGDTRRLRLSPAKIRLTFDCFSGTGHDTRLGSPPPSRYRFFPTISTG